MFVKKAYNKSAHWETHRGDEWWYTDYWCNLEAGFNNAYPGILSIDKLNFKPGQLTDDRIHTLLWSTQQQFKDNKIEILKENKLLQTIEALRIKGFVEIESTHSRYIQIINVTEPALPIKPQSSNLINKPWWRFW